MERVSTTTKTGSAFDVFKLRDEMVNDYSNYLSSFLNIKDARVREKVESVLNEGQLWPDPLIQMNPNFAPGESIDSLIKRNALHPKCGEIFAEKAEDGQVIRKMDLRKHQLEAVEAAAARENYVLTTGTGSGKSLSYIVPIVDHVLKNGSGKGLKALIIYPMNALANSQLNELERFLKRGFGKTPPVTFARYTGQEPDEERKRIQANPPDIILTNYVMMELILTRPHDRKLVEAAENLRFLVFDELHTYRGRQGADVALLARRIRERCGGPELLCVGTSATLSSDGDSIQQRAQVATFASQIFGVEVKPDRVIGETLEPVTSLQYQRDDLIRAIRNPLTSPLSYEEFASNPLAAWVENTLGVTPEASTGRLVRATPLPLSGSESAAEKLSQETAIPLEQCEQVLQDLFLLSYAAQPHPVSGRQPFAFRLHQMMSKGDSIYASIEEPEYRYLTLMGQQFVPGHRDKVLVPLVFCRECGQEYYCVSRTNEGGTEQFHARALLDRHDSSQSQAGYLYYNPDKPWSDEEDDIIERVPGDWLEDGRHGPRVIKGRRKYLPENFRLNGQGVQDSQGARVSFLPSPFHFCLECGVTYNVRQRSDIGKLAVLDTSGRSTATTLLTLSVLRGFETAESLKAEAKKLLSFTDNRQDASLQAGHFNDFIQIGWLRSSLYKAAVAAGSEGLRHEDLTIRVFQAMNLPAEHYSANPEARFQAKEDTDRALRDVLGYRLYHDLRRGWRINFPNLEQCGLLKINYASLLELSEAQDVWSGRHPALAAAAPPIRFQVLQTLLDLMRRELCIKVDYLESSFQDRIIQTSSQRLVAPWALDEHETLEKSFVLYPRARRTGGAKDRDDFAVFPLSARGGFGQYLARKSVLETEHKLSLEEREEIIKHLLRCLEIGGIVQKVREPLNEDDTGGYQLVAGAMRWVAGDVSQAPRDPIRQPNASTVGGQTNAFFIKYYKEIAENTHDYEGREHTAQVPNDQRQEREDRFRRGDLPVLFCSPTMELGVDIAQLNVVNMRNVPPTPANYAQRSGRAGRSGQPALVFTYCTTGSPHDQYYFKRPELMVAGAVGLPRLDLTNQELIAAHIRAIWLAATEADLRQSLKDVLDLSEDQLLPVTASLRSQLDNPSALKKARVRAGVLLKSLSQGLIAADWYTDGWLEETLKKSFESLNRACDRWRDLYRAARHQMDRQHELSKDSAKSKFERDQALRLHREAKNQLDILLEDSSGGSGQRASHSDFYSYRYFASEGFLPGYNFPRLPLSAYVAGRKDQEYIQRPRFLAISEFGPRSVVYHEGARYQVNRVILSVDDNEALTSTAKICRACGYLHPVDDENDPDLCQACGKELPVPLTSLFRMRHVSTKRRDRIHCDEEERFRLGYDLLTGVRFPKRGGQVSKRVGTIVRDGQQQAQIVYGQAATLWRLNLGWKRRKVETDYGFVLDLERGYWGKDDSQDEDKEDPMSKRLQKVIPYVEDRRNCVVIEVEPGLDPATVLTLQWALKNAIQVLYQLESNELAAEPLPDRDNPRCILFYESAEGGAGVLRSLLDDPEAIRKISRKALEICHFNPDTGHDTRRALKAKEDCEAACYDCLLSYGNQRDHALLDRLLLKDILMQWQEATVSSSSGPIPRAEHFSELEKLCDSQLEKSWLHYLDQQLLHLPSKAQVLIADAQARPDFLYEDERVAVFIDGPHHLYEDVKNRDLQAASRLEDLGFEVLRFKAGASTAADAAMTAEWADLILANPHIFGQPVQTAKAALELDLFDPEWHELVQELDRLEFCTIEPGRDVMDGSKVVGFIQLDLRSDEKQLLVAAEEIISELARAQGHTAIWVDPCDVAKAVARIKEVWAII